MQKTHAMQLEKQVKKRQTKKQEKKQRLSFFVVFFLAFSAATQGPKEKNNLLFSFSIASFLLFVCVVFLLFSKV